MFLTRPGGEVANGSFPIQTCEMMRRFQFFHSKMKLMKLLELCRSFAKNTEKRKFRVVSDKVILESGLLGMT